jgi:Protein of unknown function (DUF4230)
MKRRYYLVLLGLVFGAGVGTVPLYQHLTRPPPVPVFAQAKPVLVSAEEIAAVVRADAFLVSARSYSTARVEIKSGTDISSDAPADDWWKWVRNWWDYNRTRDRLTVEVSGDVLAGFNLQHIKTTNIKVTNQEVIFDLGTPEFMGVLNDEMATKFVSRETGWFRVEDKTLFLAAQALGEPKLMETACNKGALQTAGTSGTEIMERITNLLRARGDQRDVKVIFTPGQC